MKTNTIVVTSIGICFKDGSRFDTFSTLLNDHSNRSDKAHVFFDESSLNEVLSDYMHPNKSRRIDRVSKMGVIASQQCLRDSNLDIQRFKDEVGVIICTTFGAVASSRNFMLPAIANGPRNASPLIFPYTVPNAATGTLTIEAGLRGFNTTISGYNPICYTYDLLSLGRGTAFLAGGIEELAFEPVPDGVGIKPLLNTNYKMGEGSAMLLMTSADFAASQNTPPLFEICSIETAYSSAEGDVSVDNFDDIQSSAIRKSMVGAMQRSGLQASDISAIVSLGFEGDNKSKSELAACQTIWKDDVPEVIYPKNTIGETFGASDTFNLIAAYAAYKDQPGKYILSNSHQIGGNITTTIIKVATQS